MGRFNSRLFQTVFCEQKENICRKRHQARDSSNVNGLCYQNNIGRIHLAQKSIQNFKKLDVLGVVQNLQRLEQRQDAEKVRALYKAGKYVLAEPHQWFKVPSNV